MKPKYIYSLSNPINNKVYYIGCTNNIKTRLYDHCNTSSVTRVTAWIKALDRFGSKPILDIIEKIDTNSDHKKIEQFWIKLFYENGSPLINYENRKRIVVKLGNKGLTAICDLKEYGIYVDMNYNQYFFFKEELMVIDDKIDLYLNNIASNKEELTQLFNTFLDKKAKQIK